MPAFVSNFGRKGVILYLIQAETLTLTFSKSEVSTFWRLLLVAAVLLERDTTRDAKVVSH